MISYDNWLTNNPEPPPLPCEWCLEDEALAEGLCEDCFEMRQEEMAELQKELEGKVARKGGLGFDRFPEQLAVALSPVHYRRQLGGERPEHHQLRLKCEDWSDPGPQAMAPCECPSARNHNSICPDYWEHRDHWCIPCQNRDPSSLLPGRDSAARGSRRGGIRWHGQAWWPEGWAA